MPRGVRSTPLNAEKLLIAIAKEGYPSKLAFARAIHMDYAQFLHMLKRGTCRRDVQLRMEKALNLAPGELYAGEEGISKPAFYRALAGLSVRELSEKSGVSVNSIIQLENGAGDCRAFTAYCLAQAVGVPMGQYLGYEG